MNVVGHELGHVFSMGHVDEYPDDASPKSWMSSKAYAYQYLSSADTAHFRSKWGN